MATLASDWPRHFHLLLWKCWTEFNETWPQRPLPSLCFSGLSEKQDGRPGLWFAETFVTSPLKPLNRIQFNLTGSKILTSSTKFLGHRSQRLQWPIVITRCPSSVVRRPLDYLHFRLLLQNRLMDFDGTWYGWSTQGPLQVLLFFGQIRPGADPGRGKNRSRGVPFFRKLLLQTGRLQQQTECIVEI